MTLPKVAYELALSKIPGLGPIMGRQLVAHCGDMTAVWEASEEELLSIPDISETVVREIITSNPEELSLADLEFCEKEGVQITTFLDDNYPTRFKHIPDAPLLYFTRGKWDEQHARTVAIVGTRKPSPYGIQMCEQLVEDLQPYDVQIISGMAYGIDSIAHKTANQHQISNIAVMGTGMDVIYPAGHRDLYHDIQKNGAIITEYPIKMRTDWENFPRRNRLIAGLADIIIVVQSAKKGGSLITADFGNQYYKDVFAIPGRINDAASEGCNGLIKQNQAHLYQSMEDIAYIMNWTPGDTHADKQASLFVELTKQEQLIVDLLRTKEEAGVDWLHHQAKIPLSELASLLLNLEFNGVIRSLPGKQYTIS